MLALRPSRLLLLRLGAAALALAAGGRARAEVPAELAARVQDLARQGASAVQPQARIEVVLGELNPRLRLAPCNQVQPYLVPGLPVWGHTRVGLRCIDGAVRWNVSLPLQVRVFAKVLVAHAALPAGAELAAAQFDSAEADIAEASGRVFTDRAEVVGRKLDRPLMAGQTLRVTDLEKRRWFAAGERVKVHGLGPGFAVDGEGQALSVGLDDEDARIRLDNGRTVVGRAVGERLVEVVL